MVRGVRGTPRTGNWSIGLFQLQCQHSTMARKCQTCLVFAD